MAPKRGRRSTEASPKKKTRASTGQKADNKEQVEQDWQQALQAHAHVVDSSSSSTLSTQRSRDLLHLVIGQGGSSALSTTLRTAVDQSWWSRYLGPYLSEHSDDIPVCHWWVALLSDQGRSGRWTSVETSSSFANSTASTDWVPTAVATVHKTMLDTTSNKSLHFYVWATLLCHVGTLTLNHTTVHLFPDTDGPQLLHQNHVSPHLVQLYQRQYPFLKLDAVVVGNNNKKKDDKETTPPFLVTVVQAVLACLEPQPIGQDAMETEHEEKDKQDDDETFHQKSLSLARTVFLHRALEWLIQVLSSSSSTDKSSSTTWRLYVTLYLRAVHFSLRCQRTTTTTTMSTHAGATTKQLLERVRQLEQAPLELRVIQQQDNDDDSEELVWLPRTPQDTLRLHYQRANTFQKMCHRYHPHTLDDVIFCGLGRLVSSDSEKFVEQSLASLTDDQLRTLLHKLRLVDASLDPEHPLAKLYEDRSFLLQILVLDYLQEPALQTLSKTPLFPTETLLFDPVRLPPHHSMLLGPSKVLSLPKMYGVGNNFLSYADYLWRNFSLAQLESASDIKAHLVSVIRRLRPTVALANSMEDEDDKEDMAPTRDLQSTTTFSGWARMALELPKGLRVVKVEKHLLGQESPQKVLAEFTVDLQPLGDSIRKEWDSLGEHDHVFLVAVDASRQTGADAPTVQEFRAKLGYLADPEDGNERANQKMNRSVPDEDDPTFLDRFGVQKIRGGTIVHVRDESGTILTDPSFLAKENEEDNGEDKQPVMKSSRVTSNTKRIFQIELDAVQYGMDQRDGVTYSNMNLVVRRHARENSFKAVLETTQQLLLGTDSVYRVLPVWLQPLLLGHGLPNASHYLSSSMQQYAKQTVGVPNPDAFLDFGDTFLDEEHLRSALINSDESASEILVDGRGPADEPPTSTNDSARKNYRIRWTRKEGTKKKKAETSWSIEAVSYNHPQHVEGNSIRFTPKQVEAVRAGLSCGLSLVCGPPGTGKTDVAVQIIASLYHSFPTQRTIIVTHSNAALNDIFEKVMARGDVEERYMLRLGAGERDLAIESTHDFTKMGRVEYCFGRRAELLEQVQTLSESLGLSGRAERGQDGSPSYTCESAAIFYETKIAPKIAQFEQAVAAQGQNSGTFDFPFCSFFGTNEQIVARSARDYFAKLRAIFEEAAEYRPLEILRSQRQRTDYFLMKQARIIAMTSTHAAIARPHLISLGFQYDNVIIEESGQMTELDTFIPLLLQKGDAEEGASMSRLKRVCLLGDHNQLPPIIKNMSLARYSGVDESLFARLVRTGVPHIQLDKQGRSRPELANLYRWRYNALGDLDHVKDSERFLGSNAGFAKPFQFINVEDFQGKGETTPTAFFYQNLGEAEYVVAVFQYMVLLGYPPESISILTTYNGQKQLIEDILSHRCGRDTPLAGLRPNAVSTVDQYQGQQNDYILLSLVRTESIGHLRDVRRLVVAVSRARLGLYIFGRLELFRPVFSEFGMDKNPVHNLQLLLDDTYPTSRKCHDDCPKEKVFEIEDVEHMGAVVQQMQQDLLPDPQEETS